MFFFLVEYEKLILRNTRYNRTKGRLRCLKLSKETILKAKGKNRRKVKQHKIFFLSHSQVYFKKKKVILKLAKASVHLNTYLTFA